MTLAIELSLIVLLLLSIGYGFVLNRKIVALRRDQKDLEKLAVSFSKATQRAETGVAQLRAATQGSVAALQEALQRADSVKRDLEFLIDRGQGTADKLERAVRTGERGPRPATGTRGANEDMGPGTRLAVDPAERADAERQLLRALRAVR